MFGTVLGAGSVHNRYLLGIAIGVFLFDDEGAVSGIVVSDK